MMLDGTTKKRKNKFIDIHTYTHKIAYEKPNDTDKLLKNHTKLYKQEAFIRQVGKRTNIQKDVHTNLQK